MTATKRHRVKKMLLLSLFFLPTFHSTQVSNSSDVPDVFVSKPNSNVDSTLPDLRVASTSTSDVDQVLENITKLGTSGSDIRADVLEEGEENVEHYSLDPGSKSTETWQREALQQDTSNHGAGRLTLLYYPKSIKFTKLKTATTTEPLLSQIYLAALGLSVNEKATWSGLSILNPFEMPRAVVQISVEGSHLIERAKYSADASREGSDEFANIKIYPVLVAIYQPNIFKEVKKRMAHTTTGNKMVNIMLSDSKSLSEFIGGPLSPRRLNVEVLKHLKITEKEDKDFLNELANLGLLSWKVYNDGLIVPNRTMVDFYDFKFMSMHPLVDHHGPNSPTVVEARGLLLEGVKMLRDAFAKSYAQAVVVALVTAELSHDLRMSRETYSSTLREGTSNSSATYSPDFPVIFNIVLWLFITIGLSIVAICTAFMQMAVDVKPIVLIAPKKEHKMADI